MKCPKCEAENPGTLKFCGECGTPLRGHVSDSPESGPPPQNSKDVHPRATETLQTPIHELATGSTFAGRYQVIEELGRGGMGKVYKVFDGDIKEKVALKLLKPEIASDRETLERFSNELKYARKIRHKNVCGMYDLGRAEGTHFITMEYVQGEDLKSMIRMAAGLSVGAVLSIGKQICDGLAEAHGLGVVHRDLKPQNIMIDKGGSAKIMDFGIARSVREKGITGPSVMIGTPEYMSPEQAEAKEVDARSDIYSLGVILYEMATGRVPFEGDTALGIAMKHKGEAPKSPKQINPSLPDDLAGVILKCLEKDKAKRYQTVADVRAELERIEKGLPTTERAVPVRKAGTSRQITVKFNLRRAVVIPALGVLGVLAVALVVWQIVPRGAGAQRSIAVITFKNQTGDKAFDYLREAIPNLLITSLEQSKRFRVTTWEGLKDSLGELGKERDAAIDEELGFEICRRKGIETIVVGTFTKGGEMFATDAKVWDVGARQILRTAAARGQGVDSILRSQIDELSRAISKGKRLDALKIEIAPPKIAEAMTSSLEAYNYYLRGRDDLERWLDADAMKFLQRAVELDPTFAHAYLLLGIAYGNQGEGNARIEAYRKAKDHAARAPEKERLHIEAEYAAVVEKDADKRIRILEEQARKFPDEKRVLYELGNHYHNILSRPAEAMAKYQQALAIDPGYGPVLNDVAYLYADLGDFEKALDHFRKYAAVSPGDPNPLDSIAELSLRKGDLDEALRKYEEVLEVRPDFTLSALSVVYVLGLMENYPEAMRRLDEVPARAPTHAAGLDHRLAKAFLLFWLGQETRALAELAAHRELASTLGAVSNLLTNAFLKGCIHQRRGEFEAAEIAYNSWAEGWRESGRLIRDEKAMMDVGYSLVLGLLDVGRGEIGSARTKLARYARPERPGQLGFLRQSVAQVAACLEGEILLAERRPQEAVEALAKTTGFNFQGISTVSSLVAYHLPVEKDALARAYAAMGETDKAIAEYGRLMTIDRTNQVRQMIPPIYHFRLGRLYEAKGLKDKARGEYRKFLEIWKDADPGIPEVEDARRRLTGIS